MADTPEKIRRGVGRVAFLARLDEFRKLVDAGWPITIIYEDHGTSTGLSYSQFVRYVGKYLRTPSTRSTGDDQSNAQPVPPTPTETLSEPQAPSRQQRSKPTPSQPPSKPVSKPKRRAVFQHDPSSGNTRNDLI